MTSYFRLVVRHVQLNLGNKNMKIGIFTGGTSVRSENIFTSISRYPTRKHEINREYVYGIDLMIWGLNTQLRQNLSVTLMHVRNRG